MLVHPVINLAASKTLQLTTRVLKKKWFSRIRDTENKFTFRLSGSNHSYVLFFSNFNFLLFDIYILLRLFSLLHQCTNIESCINGDRLKTFSILLFRKKKLVLYRHITESLYLLLIINAFVKLCSKIILIKGQGIIA